MSVPVVTYSDFATPAKVAAARQNLAWYAQFAMFAEDMYLSSSADPSGDVRFASDWTFVDWLRTTVAANVAGDIKHWLLGTDDTTYFGALFRHAVETDHYLVAIRGTESSAEWVQNFAAAPDLIHNLKAKLAAQISHKGGDAKVHPSGAGLVPDGFFGIYQKLTMGKSGLASPLSASDGIIRRVTALQTADGKLASHATVTITGHSLGAAVCSYLAYDVAVSGKIGAVNNYVFASPHPGDPEFADKLSKAGVNSVSVVYEKDLVPTVPPVFSPLNETIKIIAAGQPTPTMPDQIVASAQIRDLPGGNHHVICYAAMLDPVVAKKIKCFTLDKDCVSCVLTDIARPDLADGSALATTRWAPLP